MLFDRVARATVMGKKTTSNRGDHKLAGWWLDGDGVRRPSDTVRRDHDSLLFHLENKLFYIGSKITRAF